MSIITRKVNDCILNTITEVALHRARTISDLSINHKRGTQPYFRDCSFIDIR